LKKLDDIDLKILNVLQEDSRVEMQELARRVCLSRTPVAIRVEKLSEHGVIKRLIAVVDRVLVGRPVLVVTHVKLEKQTTELLNAFEELVNGLPEVQFCLHVAGDWSFILHVTALSPQGYYDFLMRNINCLANVASTDSSFVLKECKSYAPLPL
jgi:Lrp/AsnC family leucine-responsive transcriptional regulator